MAYSLNNFLGPFTNGDKLLKIYNSQGLLDRTIDPFKIVTSASSNNLVILKTRSSSITLDFSTSTEAKLALEKIQEAITTLTTNTSPLFVDRYITNYISSVGATGPQGIKGATGEQGAGGSGVGSGTGTTGPQGNTGPQGPAGSGSGTGTTGPQGNTGPQGPAGSGSGTGTTGPQGNTGATGSQGSTGPQGTIGTTGSQGHTGTTGSQGVTGPQGPGNLVDSLTYSNNTISLVQQGPTLSVILPFVNSADSSALEVNNYVVSLKETITGNRIFSNNVSIAGSLTVTGTQTNVTVTDLSVQNSLITLVDGFTSGTPMYDAKISVLRGDQQSSSIKWNEVTDTWQAGLSGSESTLLLGVGFGLTRSGYTVSLDLLVTGPTGPQGSNGPQGNTGAQGSTGPNSITINSTPIISGTSGYLLFQGNGNVIKQDLNLYWDETNKRLGVGTSSPAFTLDVTGKTRLAGQGSTYSLEVTSTGNSYIVVYGNSVSSADGYLKITNATDTTGSFASTIWSRSNLTSYPSAWYLADLSIDSGNIASMRFESRINEGSPISVRPLFEWRNNTTTNMLMFASGNLMLQNGGTFSGITSSILTLNSTTKGFLPPRLTSSEKYNISSPVNGLFVYDTDLTSYSYFNGTTWSAIGTGGGTGSIGPQGDSGSQGAIGATGYTSAMLYRYDESHSSTPASGFFSMNPGIALYFNRDTFNGIRYQEFFNEVVDGTIISIVNVSDPSNEGLWRVNTNSFDGTSTRFYFDELANRGTWVDGGYYTVNIARISGPYLDGSSTGIPSTSTASGNTGQILFDIAGTTASMYFYTGNVWTKFTGVLAGSTSSISGTQGPQGSAGGETSEIVNSTPGATATSVVYDFTTGAIWYHATASTNYSANFTNIPTTNNRAITATIIISQGATGYSPTSVRIDGVTQSVKWSSGTYSVSTNKVDIVGFTFLRSGNSWSQVFGQISSFS